MICTFGDLTDVTWWRELSLPVRAVILPNGAFRAGDVGRAGVGVARRGSRAGGLRPAGQSLGGEGAHAHRRDAARVGRPDRRAAADHASGEVLREGRSSARDRHQPAVVHQDDGVPRGAAGAGPRAAVASRSTCASGTRTGSTAWPATGASAGSASSACRSRCGIRCAPTAPSTTSVGWCRTNRGCRSIRRPTCPTATPRSSAISPMASPAIPTSWTRGRPRR